MPDEEEVNPHTGELVAKTNDELVNYDPMTPEQIEELIRVLADRLENAVPVLKQLWEDRYSAERKMIEEHAKAIMNSKRSTVAEKRAEADLATIQYRHEFDNAKAILHAAEQLQGALKAKLYGYLNINKAVTATFNAGGHTGRY